MGTSLLPAATRLHHHLLVLLVDDVVGRVDVEDAYGAEARGDAAGGRSGVRVHGVDEGLDDGVVGGLQVRADGEVAGAVAVVGVVLQRRDDPVVPAHFLEVDVQAAPVAARPGLSRLVLGGEELSGWAEGLLGAPRRRGAPHPPLVEKILVDGFVVVTRARFDLVVEEIALLTSPEGQEERLLLVGPAGSSQPQSSQVQRSASSVIQSHQLQAQLLGAPLLLVLGSLEDLVDVEHFPSVAESTMEILRGPGLEQNSFLLP